ncbi:MAG: glycosyltransferase family 2 protein [Deltaproteobacteria bacterium]|nr:glycosyltransferase family 2 protein [Deltaproteobacteria bacterium]
MTQARTTDPAVSLVVVNFNGEDCIRACVESLLAEDRPAKEVIVVDSASRDGSAAVLDALERDHPQLRVIRLSENVGYAGGVNAALPFCRAELVGVLNMDIVAEPGWLAPLIELLASRPEAGAANPMLALLDGEGVNALGQDIHVTGLGFNRALGLRRENVGREPIPVSGIQGAAFLIRRRLLEEMGGMDATGFLYHEDVNLSWLLRMMGYELYCVPRSVVRHDYFLSMYPEKLFLLERNRGSLLLSYPSPLTLVFLSPMLLVTELMLWGYALLRGPAFLFAKARSYQALWRERAARRERRQLAGRLRRRSDRQLLRHMKWRYAWRQFAVLARERGPSTRRRDASSPG